MENDALAGTQGLIVEQQSAEKRHLLTVMSDYSGVRKIRSLKS